MLSRCAIGQARHSIGGDAGSGQPTVTFPPGCLELGDGIDTERVYRQEVSCDCLHASNDVQDLN